MSDEMLTKEQMDVVQTEFYSGLEALLHAARYHVMHAAWCMGKDISKHELENKIGDLCKFVYDISKDSREAVRKSVHLED